MKLQSNPSKKDETLNLEYKANGAADTEEIDDHVFQTEEDEPQEDSRFVSGNVLIEDEIETKEHSRLQVEFECEVDTAKKEAKELRHYLIKLGPCREDSRYLSELLSEIKEKYSLKLHGKTDTISTLQDLLVSKKGRITELKLQMNLGYSQEAVEIKSIYSDLEHHINNFSNIFIKSMLSEDDILDIKKIDSVYSKKHSGVRYTNANGKAQYIPCPNDFEVSKLGTTLILSFYDANKEVYAMLLRDNCADLYSKNRNIGTINFNKAL